MPNAYISKVSKSTDINIDELEALWKESVEVVRKLNKGKIVYPFVVSYFKKLVLTTKGVSLDQSTKGNLLPVYENVSLIQLGLIGECLRCDESVEGVDLGYFSDDKFDLVTASKLINKLVKALEVKTQIVLEGLTPLSRKRIDLVLDLNVYLDGDVLKYKIPNKLECSRYRLNVGSRRSFMLGIGFEVEYLGEDSYLKEILSENKGIKKSYMSDLHIDENSDAMVLESIIVSKGKLNLTGASYIDKSKIACKDGSVTHTAMIFDSKIKCESLKVRGNSARLIKCDLLCGNISLNDGCIYYLSKIMGSIGHVVWDEKYSYKLKEDGEVLIGRRFS